MVNKATLLGRVGADPETKQIQDNNNVTSLSLATSESYKDRNGEKITTTEWHKISFWRALSGVVEKYVKKGDLIYVEGKIKTNKITDSSGTSKYYTTIDATGLKMVSSLKNNNTYVKEKERSTPQVNEHLPF